MSADYNTMRNNLDRLMYSLAVLSGDEMGRGTVQSNAANAASAARDLAAQLQAAANGQAEPFLVFPSPSEVLELIND